MTVDNVLRTYGDVTQRPSVMPLIEYLTAQETQVFNTLGKTKAIQVYHQTQLDTLRTMAVNGFVVEQGADYSASANTTPTLLGNWCEIIGIDFRVTRTQQATQHYSGENELARQKTKALKDWGNQAEYDLIRSTLVSGVSGTAPTMEGIITHISKSTNTTSMSSGTVFSASILQGLMKANMDNSNGDVATDVYMGSWLKTKADGFTNKANVVVTGADVRNLVLATDVFTTGLGKLMIHYHRYIQISTDATSRLLAIRPEKHKVAVLEETYVDTTLSRSGPYDRYAVVGQFTLETRNQDSNWYSDGYNLTT